MPAVVIVQLGRELRSALVSYDDANGDAKTWMAACILAGFTIQEYVLATGPLNDDTLAPHLWPFRSTGGEPFFGERLHSEIQGNRQLLKAARSATRVIPTEEIMSAIHNNMDAARNPDIRFRVARRESLPGLTPSRRKPVQLSLF